MTGHHHARYLIAHLHFSFYHFGHYICSIFVRMDFLKLQQHGTHHFSNPMVTAPQCAWFENEGLNSWQDEWHFGCHK